MSLTKTMEQQAYDSIKQKIIAGTYKSGFHITEATLIEDLQMSRTPIRRALGKLESEDLLTHHSHYGSVVNNIQISMLEVMNMLDVMDNFAISSIERAQKKQLPFDIPALRDCIETVEWAYKEEQIQTYYQTYVQFYITLIRVNRNDLMLEIMDDLSNRFLTGAAERAFQLRKQGIKETIEEIKEIVDHLEHKKYKEATEIIRTIYVKTFQDMLL